MKEIKYYRDVILGSYSQVFLSSHPGFGAVLLIASLMDPYPGIGGLLGVIFSAIFAKWFGLNPGNIKSGTYGFNALLVGMLLGSLYIFNLPFFLILVLITFLTLLITVWLASVMAPGKLPFLSLPFILGAWILVLSLRSFGAMHLSERGIYTINDLWYYGGPTLVGFYENINALHFPLKFDIYLKSLGAIFFQYNFLAGILIASGLLFFSRIAFTLSLVGFYTGYLFFYYLNGNLSEMDYSFIGFNFILSAIAIGGFFLVPSIRSYLIVILTTPVIAILISGLGKIMEPFQLPLYSLPFSLVVILIISLLNNRYYFNKLHLVTDQHASPEKNLYAFHNNSERFKNHSYYHIDLPFFGEWKVSQGHEGNITHKNDWRFAWDFVVTGDTSKTFKLPGKSVDDFFCYNLPVLAPASGYITTIIDGLDDNNIGDVDIEHNWGNGIVIKHTDGLFTKISHLKKGSFKFRVGDYINKGEVLATCGNSGRSPEPHIHFQVQTLPFIGATTFKYPLSYYTTRKNEQIDFHSFSYPVEGETVSRVRITPLIYNAFHFIPGMKFNLNISENGIDRDQISWEVFTNSFNQSYIFCHATKSIAYFVNNQTLHYFTSFSGDRNSLLYYFYLGSYKVLLGYYSQLSIKDILPVDGFFRGTTKFFHDFIAPFKIFLGTEFSSKYVFIDEELNPQHIKMESRATARIGSRINRDINFEFILERDQITEFIVKEKGKCVKASLSV